MQAEDFIRKWSAGAQAHFIDLCRVLGVPEPGDPDSNCFERGLAKTGSTGGRTDGFADVWKRGCFAWECKAPGRSLEAALKQLIMYALPLESPPLLAEVPEGHLAPGQPGGRGPGPAAPARHDRPAQRAGHRDQ